MVIPYMNATLTSVREESVEDYGVAPTQGTLRWSGSLAIYVAEGLLEVPGDRRVDLLIQTRVEIPYSVGALVRSGDQIFYRFEGTTHARKAASIIRAELVGRVRVILEDA